MNQHRSTKEGSKRNLPFNKTLDTANVHSDLFGRNKNITGN